MNFDLTDINKYFNKLFNLITFVSLTIRRSRSGYCHLLSKLRFEGRSKTRHKTRRMRL